jgi:sugar lactone lactonase YvrE
MYLKRIALFVVVWLQLGTVLAQGITTVAGSGSAGYNGDNPAFTALTAHLYLPIGIAVDGAGNVYIADSNNHRVRKVTPAGVITTVLGTGTPDFPPTSASLALPTAVAVDSAGNLFVADTFNHRVQVVLAATGAVTTIAGTGTQGQGGDGIPGNTSALAYPYGVAVDSAGALYIADSQNHRVRKVVGGTITTIAGTVGVPGCSNANLNMPRGLAVSSAGDVFVVDVGNNRITKVTAGAMTPFAGAADCSAGAEEGAATGGARFNLAGYAASVAVTSTNDVLIADAGNHRIRMVRLGTVSTVAGSTQGFTNTCGAATSMQLNTPRGVAAIAGSSDFLVADSGNQRIRKVTKIAPCAPTLTTFSGGNNQASLAFTPGYDGGSAVTSFDASCTPGPLTGTGTASPIVVTGMTNGTSYTCTVTATNAIGTSPASNSLQGGAGAPALGFSRTTVDFGGQSMGTTSAPMTVTLTNNGATPFSVSSLSAANSQFAYTHNCTNVAAAGTCTISATFSPAASLLTPVGGNVLVTTNLSVASNAGGSPHSIVLVGTAEKSLVTHYYRSILRRAPDAGGKAFWTAEAVRLANLPANVNEAWFAMAQGFYFSAEYATFNRTNAEFVTDLFNTFFNRAPDAAGLNFWTSELSAGVPREVVLVSFLFSTEFANFTTNIFGTQSVRPERNMVMDFYRGLLARLPDDGGFNFWVGRFSTAQCAGANAVTNEADSMSSSFITSAEYTGRNRTNAQYVADLYNAFLRRGGDQGGVNFWIATLNQNAQTREQVRVAFRNSGEFSARVQAMITAGCQS